VYEGVAVNADPFLVKATLEYDPVPPVTLMVNCPLAKFGVLLHGLLKLVKVTTGVCPQLTFNETTVRAMTIQLNNWVRNDFGIVLGCGDEKRADFGDKLDACVDKIDGLLVEFWLLFIILKFIR
jgi:hypothetical protein